MVRKHKNKEDKNSKGAEKEKATDKRRNSLTDTSSISTSSNSSSVDSDEASSSSGGCDTKGTMTSPIEKVEGLDAESPTIEMEKYRRTICTDTPVDELSRDIGFRSLIHDYPITHAQPSPQMQVNVEEKHKKNGRSKKKRDKKGKKNSDPERPLEDQISSIRKLAEEDELRKQIEQSFVQRRIQDDNTEFPRQHMHQCGEFSPYGPFVTVPLSYYNGKNNCRVGDKEKLQATVGFGIAATGIYDKIPLITGARSDKGPYYSDMVGIRKENWRSKFEETFLREHNHLGPLYVERDSLEEFGVKMNELPSSVCENKWMCKLLKLVLEGKIKKVWRRVQAIQTVLRTREGNHPYKTLGSSAMLELVMQGIVKMLTDRKENTNVVMYLSSHMSDSKPCFFRNHRQCMMTELILSSLTPFAARSLLSMSTKTSGRSAIHYAAISGQPCQLDTLLKFDVNTNIFDQSKQAPIHYLINRNNLLMVRQLMWHGADLSLVEPIKCSIPSELINQENYETCKFLKDRMVALERCMSAWLKAICAGKWKLGEPASALHSARLSTDGHVQKENCFETGAARLGETHSLKLSMRPTILRMAKNNSEQMIILFMLPVTFSPYDAMMPPENPHIVRSRMIIEKDYFGRPAEVIKKYPRLHVSTGLIENCHTLAPAFHEIHNGFIYAWRFPKTLSNSDVPTLSFSLDPSQMSKIDVRYTQLFIQAYIITNLHTKPKSD